MSWGLRGINTIRYSRISNGVCVVSYGVEQSNMPGTLIAALTGRGWPARTEGETP
jgi:hypothetical protein